METEKKEYMKKKILYDELRTILLEYQCNTLANDEMIKIQSSPQVYEVLQEFLVVQEASQYLAPFTASPVSLLALTDKDLHSSAEVEKQACSSWLFHFNFVHSATSSSAKVHHAGSNRASDQKM